MPFNSVFSWFIKKRVHQIELFKKYPIEVQTELFEKLIQQGVQTAFGKQHHFDKIKSISDYQQKVPLQYYDDIKPWVERIKAGEQKLLWPTKVKWFAKSSGTTNDRSKYIPVTKEALEDCHYKGGKDLLSVYYHLNPAADLFGGKTLVVGGSAETIDDFSDAYSGDLSAIILKNLPIWVELRRTPNREIALMSEWEEKVEKMAQATKYEDVRLLVGVPSWTLVLLKRILEITGKNNIMEVWPNFQMYLHGGINFEPYREQYNKIFGYAEVHFMQNYNASEGFFGLQDRLNENDMLLMLDYGIFYEFIPMAEFEKENAKAITLNEIETDINYAIIITTNAGLWRYVIGDTIKFTSLKPFRIQVTGRTQHHINAFGEELMIDNAAQALAKACKNTGAIIEEYTAAPIFMGLENKGGHEWIIEFEKTPENINQFTIDLDNELRVLNSDYDAKRTGDLSINKPLIHIAPTGTFHHWMKNRGKLGGQNKVPRLSNKREYVESILNQLNKSFHTKNKVG